MQLIQMCVQGQWLSESSLLSLPHFDYSVISQLNQALASDKRQLSWQCGVKEIATLPELLVVCEHNRTFLTYALSNVLSTDKLSQVRKFIFRSTWRRDVKTKCVVLKSSSSFEHIQVIVQPKVLFSTCLLFTECEYRVGRSATREKEGRGLVEMRVKERGKEGGRGRKRED